MNAARAIYDNNYDNHLIVCLLFVDLTLITRYGGVSRLEALAGADFFDRTLIFGRVVGGNIRATIGFFSCFGIACEIVIIADYW